MESFLSAITWYLLVFAYFEKSVGFFFLEHRNEIFGVFKGWKIMTKREVGKQIVFGGFMRYGWIVRMVMALHCMTHYCCYRWD